jgi:poly [ADP-ribose] polymerase
MAKFKEEKIKEFDDKYDPQKSGFTETKLFKVLFCGNVEGNNNKFYCLELQYNPKTSHYRLFSHYGRLGQSEIFGLRDVDFDTNKPVADYSVIEKEFNAIIKKKLTGKNIKDDRGVEDSRRENYQEVATFSPKVGSPNIRDKSTVIQVKSVPIDTSTIKNSKIVKLIDQIVEENVHNITSLTSLTLTSNGFETPLGPVTKEHVHRAKSALDVLKPLMKDDKLDQDNQKVREANNLYYSLIPHSFGHKITISDWILDGAKLMQEYDLLDQLESAVQMGSSLNKNASQKLSAIGVDIDEIQLNDKEFQRLEYYVTSSRASNHRGSDVWNYRVKNIYQIKIPQERTRFESAKDKYGNVKELFHGSRNCNILSILKNGLIVPSFNALCAGRMMGDGLYSASNSTKSLNYSTGWWGGTKNKYNNAFLFIVNFAMGKSYIVKGPTNKPPIGYHSIWAQAGGSLYNDEYIVYNLNQATITHLIEMVK